MTNTGYRNTGDRNTGDRNTGDRNTGDRNTGNRNTGDRNTGHRNTGDRNTGNRNTGHRNTGDRNTGFLNTISPQHGLLFNKTTKLWDEYGSCLVDFPRWFYFDVQTPCVRISSEEMTEKEKEENPSHKTTGWYLKEKYIEDDMKVHRRCAFNQCENLEDIKKTLELPNFDYDIFEEITGITKEDFDRKLWKNNEEIVINGITYVPKQ